MSQLKPSHKQRLLQGPIWTKIVPIARALTLVMAGFLASNSVAVIKVQKCDSATVQDVKLAINGFFDNLERIKNEDYSFSSYTDEEEDIVDADLIYQIHRWISDESRFEIGMTEGEHERIRQVLLEDDITISCAREIEPKCMVAGGVAWEAQSFVDRFLWNGGLKKKATICDRKYDTHSCEFKSLVVHELLHFAKIPTHRDHNLVPWLPEEKRKPIIDRDKIYQISKAFENSCEFGRKGYEIGERHNGVTLIREVW